MGCLYVSDLHFMNQQWSWFQSKIFTLKDYREYTKMHEKFIHEDNTCRPYSFDWEKRGLGGFGPDAFFTTVSAESWLHEPLEASKCTKERKKELNFSKYLPHRHEKCIYTKLEICFFTVGSTSCVCLKPTWTRSCLVFYFNMWMYCTFKLKCNVE